MRFTGMFASLFASQVSLLLTFKDLPFVLITFLKVIKILIRPSGICFYVFPYTIFFLISFLLVNMFSWYTSEQYNCTVYLLRQWQPLGEYVQNLKERQTTHHKQTNKQKYPTSKMHRNISKLKRHNCESSGSRKCMRMFTTFSVYLVILGKI